MDRVALHGRESGFPFCDKKWALVSIHSDAKKGSSAQYLTHEVEGVLNGLGMVEGLSLRFWDITDDPETLKSLDQWSYKYILFDEKMANRVVKFVDRLIASKEEIVLVAHCDAGISRSGAVAQFAAERASLDMEDFWMENRQLSPNPFVKRLLRAAAHVEPMSAEDVRRQKESDEAVGKLLDKYGHILV